MINTFSSCKNDKEAERALMKFYAEKDALLDEKIPSGPERLNQSYEEWKKNHVTALAVQKCLRLC